MDSQFNVISGPGIQSRAAVPGLPPIARTLYWSIKRELWENRSIYIAPLIVAGLILLGNAIGGIGGNFTSSINGANHTQTFSLRSYDFAADLIMGTTLLVAIFYCLDALYGERRDRSILFWKSMPVSDTVTVLAKASIPLVVIPLLTFGLTVVTQAIMFLLNGTIFRGLNPEWVHPRLLQDWVGLLYHLVAIHSLWYSPFFAWMLLVSAWARRAVFLWAVLPPAGIGILERLVFHSSHFAEMLKNRVDGPQGSMNTHSMTRVTPAELLAAPGLWIGLAITAIFLGLAIQLRRYRGPV
ncbi:MAG: ABC transporter permease [Silvibacterium sp.]|nr:ABC transporter permease [Silvibacterium sp.]